MAVFQNEMDKYLTALSSETMKALDRMENQIHRLGPMQNEFKIGFLKSANYQYVLLDHVRVRCEF